jgi:hypothetical protein
MPLVTPYKGAGLVAGTHGVMITGGGWFEWSVWAEVIVAPTDLSGLWFQIYGAGGQVRVAVGAAGSEREVLRFLPAPSGDNGSWSFLPLAVKAGERVSVGCRDSNSGVNTNTVWVVGRRATVGLPAGFGRVTTYGISDALDPLGTSTTVTGGAANVFGSWVELGVLQHSTRIIQLRQFISTSASTRSYNTQLARGPSGSEQVFAEYVMAKQQWNMDLFVSYDADVDLPADTRIAIRTACSEPSGSVNAHIFAWG